ncbi:uncharacterized protein LOC142036030 isoform X2 [Buteo buteo]|uniref:uncharacterized protein LOC142036030 isoform X2 n=1 Tax=Buteo buteo TaxID=30397 RepID=UPI003EBCC8BE
MFHSFPVSSLLLCPLGYLWVPDTDEKLRYMNEFDKSQHGEERIMEFQALWWCCIYQQFFLCGFIVAMKSGKLLIYITPVKCSHPFMEGLLCIAASEVQVNMNSVQTVF